MHASNKLPVHPNLASKVAAVTGGSGGIGAATGRLLARQRRQRSRQRPPRRISDRQPGDTTQEERNAPDPAPTKIATTPPPAGNGRHNPAQPSPRHG